MSLNLYLKDLKKLMCESNSGHLAFKKFWIKFTNAFNKLVLFLLFAKIDKYKRQTAVSQ